MRKYFQLFCLSFLLFGCGKQNSTSVSNVTSTSANSSKEVSSEVNHNSEIEESQYIAVNRVNVTLNFTLPLVANDVYVVGEFNNWGEFNTLIDESYKVNVEGSSGSISINNVEKDKNYKFRLVQKISDATYTYNFASSVKDKNSKHVIGYTSDNILISAFAIEQEGEDFNFAASEGASFSYEVSAFKAFVGGDEYQGGSSNNGIPDYGFHIKINDNKYIELTSLGEKDFQGRDQYVAYKVSLEVNDVITLYDGDNGVNWINTALEEFGAYASFETNDSKGIICKEKGTYDIYVKLKMNDDTIYIGNA